MLSVVSECFADMPGTLGVRSSCLPFMLIMAWTGIIRSMLLYTLLQNSSAISRC